MIACGMRLLWRKYNLGWFFSASLFRLLWFIFDGFNCLSMHLGIFGCFWRHFMSFCLSLVGGLGKCLHGLLFASSNVLIYCWWMGWDWFFGCLHCGFHCLYSGVIILQGDLLVFVIRHSSFVIRHLPSCHTDSLQYCCIECYPVGMCDGIRTQS